jgi:hypothetical protein
MRRRQMIVIALAVALGASCAHAAENTDDGCRLFPDPDTPGLGLARVTAAHRVRLNDDPRPDCLVRCSKAQLVRGDIVLTERSHESYVCAYFLGPDGRQATGWIRSSDLTPLPIHSAPQLRAWTGGWVRDENHIHLSVQGRDLAVHGEAIWYAGVKGVDDPFTGEVDGVSRPTGASVAFKDDDCRVKLRLIGPYLVADDNRQCGGQGVGFGGAFRRKITDAKSPRPPPRSADPGPGAATGGGRHP